MVDVGPSINGRVPEPVPHDPVGEPFTIEDANAPGEAKRAADEAKAVALLAKGSRQESGGARTER